MHNLAIRVVAPAQLCLLSHTSQTPDKPTAHSSSHEDMPSTKSLSYPAPNHTRGQHPDEQPCQSKLLPMPPDKALQHAMRG